MTDAKIPRIGVTDQVIGQIRTALEAGALLPGTMLGVAELARQFGVSAGAVQKALGSLESESLVDSTGARTYVITPTPAWYLAILAHSSGLSIAAAQTAVPLMPDAARAGFDRAAAAACEAWSSRTVPQTDAAVGTWGLLDLLAGETQNPHLAREHHRLKTALAFGTVGRAGAVVAAGHLAGRARHHPDRPRVHLQGPLTRRRKDGSRMPPGAVFA